MKYAIANMNYFNNDLKIIKVEADNPIVAIVDGVCQLTNNGVDVGVDKWLNSFLKDIPTDGDYEKRITEIQEEFFNADQLVAVMPIEDEEKTELRFVAITNDLLSCPEAKKDTEEFSHLISYVEDEVAYFIIDPKDPENSYWPADEFFHMVNIGSFLVDKEALEKG